MSNQLQSIEAEALKLSDEERAHLADRLLASLSEDAEIEEAWAIESDPTFLRDAPPLLRRESRL